MMISTRLLDVAIRDYAEDGGGVLRSLDARSKFDRNDPYRHHSFFEPH
ncbi:hypothetical protein SNOG_04769 [Parastagonospora nodorum SN15]|uniref:Uncharacterized protein n=1 Tax=Phaeosphaeria nodorum (strain SN15 / ATCC MYA-4574 / FGSC 10173) TaxID=321614 RepID=Q0UTZ5_PHANO|nr:hypothetical protein SNOG_04769 [Parastagonospora nodorum SN15]EAT88529.1 hypothetical protein SNOG_04769 [Parastagonospora nodorum SN15]